RPETALPAEFGAAFLWKASPLPTPLPFRLRQQPWRFSEQRGTEIGFPVVFVRAQNVRARPTARIGTAASPLRPTRRCWRFRPRRRASGNGHRLLAFSIAPRLPAP